MGSDGDIGFNRLEQTKDIRLIDHPEPEALNAFISFKYMLLGHICISFMMMQTYLLQFDCIRFLVCFVILIKIDDYLTPHFVFDVLHSGTSLPDALNRLEHMFLHNTGYNMVTMGAHIL